MKIDDVQWNEERARVELELRQLKERRRESHRPRWTCGVDDHALLGLRRQATMLYRVRAHLRQRVHSPGMTVADQEELVKSSLARWVQSSEIPAASNS
jgi:hypothetical protein